LAFTKYETRYSELPSYSPEYVEGTFGITPFELINHDGDVITEAAMDGKITVVNYFFTHCPSICPKMTRNLKHVQDLYNDEPSVQIFSYTVDPKRDSSARLAAYADKFAIQLGQWQFITGDKKDLYRLARNAYRLSATDGDGGPGDFIHSENLVLVDQKGRIRGYYDGTDRKQVDQLITDIAKLKKSNP
jgi:protein SCO1/2